MNGSKQPANGSKELAAGNPVSLAEGAIGL
jgi:hypothetical protein